MFDAVIFDMDGLLLDTEIIATKAGQIAFKAAGIDAPVSFFHEMVGVDSQNCRKLARSRYGDSLDMDLVDQVWDRTFDELTSKHIPFMPYVEDVMDWLVAAGIPRAIATSSTYDSAHRKVKIAGLDRWVETIVSCDCVQNPKPAPDPYLEAAKRLNVPPSRCAAFEDSDPGARAALAAGMTVIQVPDIIPAGAVNVHHTAGNLLEGLKVSGLMTA